MWPGSGRVCFFATAEGGAVAVFCFVESHNQAVGAGRDVWRELQWEWDGVLAACLPRAGGCPAGSARRDVCLRDFCPFPVEQVEKDAVVCVWRCACAPRGGDSDGVGLAGYGDAV